MRAEVRSCTLRLRVVSVSLLRHFFKKIFVKTHFEILHAQNIVNEMIIVVFTHLNEFLKV